MEVHRGVVECPPSLQQRGLWVFQIALSSMLMERASVGGGGPARVGRVRVGRVWAGAFHFPGRGLQESKGRREPFVEPWEHEEASDFRGFNNQIPTLWSHLPNAATAVSCT